MFNYNTTVHHNVNMGSCKNFSRFRIFNIMLSELIIILDGITCFLQQFSVKKHSTVD